MKKLINGVIAMIIFYIFNMLIMQIIGQFIFIGDDFIISYHIFTYTGVMILCGIIIVCTYIIVEKLNDIKKKLNDTNIDI
ncbi:MAG: hypothetical protein KAH05_05665 [Clostridiales bacterium]|nr:hypothetical protein [Clostridiales bacterium]